MPKRPGSDAETPTQHEQIEVPGNALVDQIKELIRQGNIRRLIVRRPSGEALVEIPLTAGLGVATLLTLFAPVLAALAAMGALIAQFRVEIQRAPPASEDPPRSGPADPQHDRDDWLR
ncbi:hypothetical protein CKO25_09560 [Thiocapsa imhoffii]|uniref:DUF4342 domain-containing protein n=1 Tax=Thiocapsa imhoffii TaxID=382777 RepID=A0A9X0WI17_9GAMM|nr:DUF4342 domain-containing protein [Thiocapsa imhoffii]MBK1644891.1 hypothetical protein [Thiocapsa imhoffii]